MKRKQQYKVVIGNEHTMYAHVLKLLVEQNKSYKVVHVTNLGKSLLEYIKTNEVDILITDIVLKDTDAYRLLKQIKRRHPHLNVLVVSERLHPYTLSYMVKYGAKGAVPLTADTKELYRAIDSISQGKYHYNKFMRKPFVTDVLSGKTKVYEFDRKELQFIRLTVKDIRYDKIALKMKLPIRRVESYREDLFKEFGIRNRTGFLLFALNTGLASIY